MPPGGATASPRWTFGSWPAGLLSLGSTAESWRVSTNPSTLTTGTITVRSLARRFATRVRGVRVGEHRRVLHGRLLRRPLARVVEPHQEERGPAVACLDVVGDLDALDVAALERLADHDGAHGVRVLLDERLELGLDVLVGAVGLAARGQRRAARGRGAAGVGGVALAPVGGHVGHARRGVEAGARDQVALRIAGDQHVGEVLPATRA